MKKQILLAVLLITCASARATVIFSNFGPGDTYDDSGFTVVASQSVAASFKPTSNTTFAGADLALIAHTAGSVNIALRASSGDMPGSVIETFTTNVAGAGIYSVTSAANPLLQAGETYWISVSSVGSFVGTWCDNSVGQEGLALKGSGNWFSYLAPTPTFRVLGASAVPAPLAALPFALGLLARRRGKR